MSPPKRLWLNPLAVICAVAGLLLGGTVGLSMPVSVTYRATAKIAMIPGANLTTADASGFWDVLTQGQVSRTAAAVYADPRWTASAATAAGVSAPEIYLTAGAIPDTTVVTITADAPTAHAAEAAVADVLVHATPEVSSVLAPFQVRVVSPPAGASAMTTSHTQRILAGALAGLVFGAAAGIGIAWLRARRART